MGGQVGDLSLEKGQSALSQKRALFGYFLFLFFYLLPCLIIAGILQNLAFSTA